MTATPSARGGRTEAPRPSFRLGRGARTPNPTTRNEYKARNAVERGLGWLKATRYNPYAHRFLGFLYLAGDWIWLQSYLNAT